MKDARLQLHSAATFLARTLLFSLKRSVDGGVAVAVSFPFLSKITHKKKVDPSPSRTQQRPTSTIPFLIIQYHTIPWVCYRRRNQWLRLALALFCLPLIWLARVVCLTYVEATVFGVGVNVGCDDCNDDGRTSPGSAIAMERGEASTVRMSVRNIKQKLSN